MLWRTIRVINYMDACVAAVGSTVFTVAVSCWCVKPSDVVFSDTLSALVVVMLGGG